MAENKTKKTATRKRKITTQVDKGRVYIQSSFNNTIVTVTDAAGNALAACSAGALGYKGSKKSTPFAAGQAAAKLLTADSLPLPGPLTYTSTDLRP